MRRRLAPCVAMVAVTLAATACGGPSPRARARVTRAPARATAPVVMFLGDSYTTGRLGQTPESTYAAETARDLGWQVILGGYRGTGFVSTGHVGKDFSALFDEQLAWRPAPDLLIVSGGHNDRAYRPDLVKAAAGELLTAARRRWPTARLLLIGPMWGGDPDPEVTAVRDSMAALARESRVPFVDPLGEHWITGDRAAGTGDARRYILPDGIHPTAEGTRHIADRLVADLHVLGLAAP